MLQRKKIDSKSLNGEIVIIRTKINTAELFRTRIFILIYGKRFV